MNYLKEVLAFHDWLETNQCDTIEQALWFHLMAINNKCGWPVWFTVANMTLQAKLGGIDKKTLDRRRNDLCNKKRIEYISQGKKQAGKYRMIPFEDSIRGFNPLETTLSVTSDDLNQTPLNKQNRNETKPERYTPEFEEWYSSWPRPGAKADSFKNFEKVRKAKGIDFVWQCTRNYKNYLNSFTEDKRPLAYQSNNFFGQKAYYLDYEQQKVVSINGTSKSYAAYRG